MLPVFEELNGLLFYPLEYEGEEASYNVFYGSSVPDNKAIPAVKYLMSKDGGSVKRFVLEGTDYVYPRTSNKIIRAYLKSKGVADEDIMENYTPFGFSDWQTEVAGSRRSAPPERKLRSSPPSTATPMCRSTRSSAIRASRRRTFR